MNSAARIELAAQAVGEALGRRALRQRRRAPGDEQAEHVGEVVAGVGEQARPSSTEAISRLDQDEGDVEDGADQEGAAEILRRVAVAGMVVSDAHGHSAAFRPGGQHILALIIARNMRLCARAAAGG